MKQIEQRRLGLRLAKAVGATETRAAIGNKHICFADILKTAVTESEQVGGLELLVSKILKGPPEWAYAALFYVPNLGFRRTALLQRVAEEPAWAFHTLRDIPDLGNYRDALLEKVAEDSAWAHMALREVSNLGPHRENLLLSVARDSEASRLALLQVPDLGRLRHKIEAAAAQCVVGPASLHSDSVSG